MNKNSTSNNFAKGWDTFEGNYSLKIANNILLYCESNNKKIKNILDICCGSGNYIKGIESRGLKCFGTETENSFIEYCKSSLKNPNVKLTKKANEIPFKESFDLISCNHAVVNTFENFEEWKILFKNVFKQLSNNGLFIFDFDTKFKLSNANEVLYKSNKRGDLVLELKTQKYDKCSLSYTFYLSEKDCMSKTKEIIIESYYDSNFIIDELKKTGFKTITTLNENFDHISDLENIDKIVVIASKK